MHKLSEYLDYMLLIFLGDVVYTYLWYERVEVLFCHKTQS